MTKFIELTTRPLEDYWMLVHRNSCCTVLSLYCIREQVTCPFCEIVVQSSLCECAIVSTFVLEEFW
jgi:hypothetical protein